VHVKARVGEPLIAEWSCGKHVVTVQSAALDRAQNRGVSLDVLRDQFGRLGNTPYRLEEITLDVEGAPFVSTSALNQLRREAVDRLREAAVSQPRYAVDAATPSILSRPTASGVRRDSIEGVFVGSKPELHVLIRTKDQLDPAIDLKPASITLDYLDLY